MTTEERFWSKVKKTDNINDCWIWTARKNKKGHGEFRYNNKHSFAHRFSYKLHTGENIDNKIVRHTCDNPACVNPNHLIIGTHQD